MLGKLVAILCVLNYALAPCCAAACAARNVAAGKARPAAPAACAQASRGCCKATTKRCHSKVATPPPERSEPPSRCDSCRCRPPKDPVVPSSPTPEPRSIAPRSIIPDVVQQVAPLPDGQLTPARLGHDPPAAFVSNNDRQAQIAVWLK
jgi:hypothetical protein